MGRRDDSELTAGQQVLGRYRIVDTLGHGGMGVVYLARTEGAAGFARPVVVKSMLPDLLERSDLAELFIREARILSNLDHPGIVRVLDFGRQRKRHLMVLEYVSGYDLGCWRRFLTKTKTLIPIELATHIICLVLDALDYAHGSRGDEGKLKTVHRDVSPSNILLSDEGRVRLTDFGIASIVSDSDERTRATSFRGKVIYAAPELLAGGEPTAQSDIYSAGLVLYQLIAGRNPLIAPADAPIVDRIQAATIPPVTESRPEVPASLEQVLKRALAKDPNERFASAGQFADALRRIQTTSPDQLQQQLANRLREDFYGSLPEVMRVDTLEERDQAWRSAKTDPGADDSAATAATQTEPRSSPGSPSQSSASLSSPSSARQSARTVAAPHHRGELQLPVLSSQKRKQRRRLAWLAVPVAAVVTGWLLLALPSQHADGKANEASERDALSDRKDVLSDGASRDKAEPHAGAASSAAFAQGSASAAGLTTATSGGLPIANDNADDPAAEAHGTQPSATRSEQLAETVSNHAHLIKSCHERFAGVDLSTPVRMGFRLKRSGEVQSVNFSPAQMAKTDFGRCVAIAYRSVPFGKQPSAVSFHVPIHFGEVLGDLGRR